MSSPRAGAPRGSTALVRTARQAIGSAWRWLVRTARLAVGQPDYEAYVAHLRERHPTAPVPSREAFFSERLLARYGRGRSRCC